MARRAAALFMYVFLAGPGAQTLSMCQLQACDDAGQQCVMGDALTPVCLCDTGHGAASGAAATCIEPDDQNIDDCTDCPANSVVFSLNPNHVEYWGVDLAYVPFMSDMECVTACTNRGDCNAVNYYTSLPRFIHTPNDGACLKDHPCCHMLKSVVSTRQIDPLIDMKARTKEACTPPAPCDQSYTMCVDESFERPGEWKCACNHDGHHGGEMGGNPDVAMCEKFQVEYEDPHDECVTDACIPGMSAFQAGALGGTFLQKTYRLDEPACQDACQVNPNCFAAQHQREYDPRFVQALACIPGRPCCWLFGTGYHPMPVISVANHTTKDVSAPCAWSTASGTSTCESGGQECVDNDMRPASIGTWTCNCIGNRNRFAQAQLVLNCDPTSAPSTPAPLTLLPPTPTPPTPTPPTPTPPTLTPPTSAPATAAPSMTTVSPTLTPSTAAPVSPAPPTPGPPTTAPTGQTRQPQTTPQPNVLPSLSPQPLSASPPLPQPSPSPTAGATPAPLEATAIPEDQEEGFASEARDAVRSLSSALGVGALAGASNGLHSTRNVVLTGTCDPFVNTTDVRYMVRSLSPLQLSVGGSMAAGAVVGNAGLLLLATVAVYAVSKFIGVLLPKSVQEELVDSRGVVVFPSIPILVAMVLAQGTMLGSFEIFFHPESTLQWGLGCAGVIACFFFVAYLACVTPHDVRNRAAFIPDSRPTSKCAAFFIGENEWVSIDRQVWYADRWSTALRPFLPSAPAFIVLDCMVNYTTAAIYALKPITWEGCGHVQVASAVIFLVMGGVSLKVRPHVMGRNTVLDVFILGGQSAGSGLYAAGYYARDFEHGAFGVADRLFLGVTVLIALRTACDTVATLMVMKTKRRERLQVEYWAGGGAAGDATKPGENNPTLASMRVPGEFDSEVADTLSRHTSYLSSMRDTTRDKLLDSHRSLKLDASRGQLSEASLPFRVKTPPRQVARLPLSSITPLPPSGDRKGDGECGDVEMESMSNLSALALPGRSKPAAMENKAHPSAVAQGESVRQRAGTRLRAASHLKKDESDGNGAAQGSPDADRSPFLTSSRRRRGDSGLPLARSITTAAQDNDDETAPFDRSVSVVPTVPPLASTRRARRTVGASVTLSPGTRSLTPPLPTGLGVEAANKDDDDDDETAPFDRSVSVVTTVPPLASARRARRTVGASPSPGTRSLAPTATPPVLAGLDPLESVRKRKRPRGVTAIGASGLRCPHAHAVPKE
eukprot:TRINITY_DN9155_c0_g3_i1.p1 TRINITY_DN9155_c0_g3~~TRINITY_DN9155_c0_g3_i1.p1  ORF type:complete len:1250 (+),score=76.30 TRINITY_DN9155_c0_g3_i1:65-3751(+)